MATKFANYKTAYYLFQVQECQTCHGTGIFENVNPMNNSVKRSRCPDCLGRPLHGERRVNLTEALTALGVKVKN